MKDLSERSGKMEAQIDKKYYPSFSIEEDKLPGLKEKKVKDKIMLKVECEIKGISQYGNGDIEYRIELKKGEIVTKGK